MYMALSFKDSLKNATTTNSSSEVSVDNDIATYDLDDSERAVYDEEMSTYADDGYTSSGKYLWYSEYSDSDISTVDSQKKYYCQPKSD